MLATPSTVHEVKLKVGKNCPELRACERQFLEFALSNPFDVAFGTLTAVARNAGVSANTAIYTLRHLGFADFRSFRDMFRREFRAKTLSRPA